MHASILKKLQLKAKTIPATCCRRDQLNMTPCATGLTMRPKAAAAVEAPLTLPFTLFLQLLFTA